MKKPSLAKVEEREEKRLPGQKIDLDRVSRLAFIIALLAALVLIALALLPRLQFFGQNVSRWLNYPYFQAGSEGLMLSEAAIVRAGGSLYVPLRPDLFISGPYPPLYYYLLAWLWPAGQEAASGFFTGRLISLVAAFSVAIFIVALALLESQKFSGDRKIKIWQKWPGLLAGLIAGSVFLSMPAVAVWAVRVRADMLMVAFQMVALALLAWKPRGWPAFAAILPLALAFYTKHTGLAAPAAAFVFVLIQQGRDWRRSLAWVGTLAGAIGLPFILLNLLTANEFFLRLFPYHDLGRDDRNFARYLELFWQENAALVIMGLGLVLVALFWPVKQTLTERLANVPLSGWFLLFSLPLLWGMGVVGTDHNHFLPTEAAGCAAAGVLLGRWLALPASNRARWLAFGALAGIWVQLAFCAIPAQRYEIEFRERPADYQRQLGQIVLNAANQPGPILSSEAGFLALANRSADHYYYNDLFTLTALARQGRYSLEGLLQAVREKQFGVILAEGNFFSGERIRPDVWPPELVEALKQNYRLKFRDVWFVYEPQT